MWKDVPTLTAPAENNVDKNDDVERAYRGKKNAPGTEETNRIRKESKEKRMNQIKQDQTWLRTQRNQWNDRFAFLYIYTVSITSENLLSLMYHHVLPILACPKNFPLDHSGTLYWLLWENNCVLVLNKGVKDCAIDSCVLVSVEDIDSWSRSLVCRWSITR